MVVNTNSKEILIPLHKDIVQRVNHAEKKIQVELPNNFFDLF